jgi:hypothetical protein
VEIVEPPKKNKKGMKSLEEKEKAKRDKEAFIGFSVFILAACIAYLIKQWI